MVYILKDVTKETESRDDSTELLVAVTYKLIRSSVQVEFSRSITISVQWFMIYITWLKLFSLVYFYWCLLLAAKVLRSIHAPT